MQEKSGEARKGREIGRKVGKKDGMVAGRDVHAGQEGGMVRRLRAYAAGLVPDAGKKQAALEAVRRETEKKKVRYTPSFPEVVGIQLQYMSPVFWGTQGAVLAAVLLLLCGTALRQGGLTDYLWWGSMAAAWMGQMACGELVRHLAGGMAELEQSCYINLPQMWTIRMILAGSVDMLILCICCGGIAWNTGSSLLQVGLYLLVPFVLSNLCGFTLLEIMRGSWGRYGQAASAVWIAVLALVPGVAPVLYGTGFLWLWVTALVLGAVLLAGELRRCYRKIERGEAVCWN